MKIFWTDEALDNLSEISEFIAADSPHRALSYVRKIKSRPRRLNRFPLSGRTVPETTDLPGALREIIVDNYRVIYTIQPDCVQVISVIHGMRKLNLQ